MWIFVLQYTQCIDAMYSNKQCEVAPHCWVTTRKLIWLEEINKWQVCLSSPVITLAPNSLEQGVCHLAVVLCCICITGHKWFEIYVFWHLRLQGIIYLMQLCPLVVTLGTYTFIAVNGCEGEPFTACQEVYCPNQLLSQDVMSVFVCGRRLYTAQLWQDIKPLLISRKDK